MPDETPWRRTKQLEAAERLGSLAACEWNLRTNALTGSPALMTLLGLDPTTAVPSMQSLLDIVAPNERNDVARKFHEAAEGSPLDVEFRIRPPKLAERTVRIAAETQRDAEGRPLFVAGVVQNVTDRRRLEERLQQAERVSVLGRVSASVAHEFNNVLMAISPLADLIARRGDAKSAGLARQITEGVARGKRITQQILEFTRTPVPRRAVVDVAEWLASSRDELARLAGARVDVRVESDIAANMLADAQQLRQVFANLVVNARDAMPDGGSIAIGTTVDDGFVHFTIRDSGTGIPFDLLRLIFEPLFTTKRFGGTGLGLAVAQQVIQHHGGNIYAESEPGAGTTFHVLIPMASDSADADAAPPRSFFSRRVQRITLIEDDEVIASGIASILDLEGIIVDIVSNGRDAAARIALSKPDAVVLDLRLGDVDGTSVYQEIAARWPDLPVLFSTGHGDEKALRDYLAKPHVGCLMKPYEVGTLLEALDRLYAASVNARA